MTTSPVSSTTVTTCSQLRRSSVLCQNKPRREHLKHLPRNLWEHQQPTRNSQNQVQTRKCWEAPPHHHHLESCYQVSLWGSALLSHLLDPAPRVPEINTNRWVLSIIIIIIITLNLDTSSHVFIEELRVKRLLAWGNTPDNSWSHTTLRIYHLLWTFDIAEITQSLPWWEGLHRI